MVQDSSCQKHLDVVLEAAGFDLWENDVVDGSVIRPVSKVFAELGYSPEEFARTIDGLLSIIHPEDLDAMRQSLDAHIKGESESYQAEFRVRSKSGEWFWYANYGKLVDRTSTSAGCRLVGVSINVNERKLREREIERLNVQLAEQNAILQQLATTDAMTGVANRRRLLELGESEFERARRLDHALALLILDIDDFKAVNDAWGHLNGDHVIRRVASICAQNVRLNVDVVGRFGGEEFAVLLPEVSESSAMALAERLRAAIGSEVIVLDGGGAVTRTVSIGVASLAPDCESFVSFLARADQGLYAAKRRGKNCVAKPEDQ